MSSSILCRYEQAQTLLQGWLNTHLVKNEAVYPHWIENSHCFWYLKDTENGKQFRMVNADTASNTVAFDHQALADSLALVTGHTINADNLPIKQVTFSLSSTQIDFRALDKNWRFDTATAICEEDIAWQKIDHDVLTSEHMNTMPDFFLQTLPSPNGKKELLIQDHNLWIRDRESGKTSALTHTGTADESFARSSYLNVDPTIQAMWSPDSKCVFTLQLDTREITERMLCNYAPQDGSLYPKIIPIKSAYPGDEHVETYRLVVIDVETGHLQTVDYSPVPFILYSDGMYGFFSLGLGWWSTDSQRAFFIDTSRGSKAVRLVELDTHTGSTRVLVEEKSATFVKLHHGFDRPHFLPLPETHELIWFSERSGWAHLYLYDLTTGQLKHPITEGEWLVRDLLHFDANQREILVQTAARDPAISPYYRDICKINIDSGLLTPLATGNFDHYVSNNNNFSVVLRNQLEIDHITGIGINGVSPDGQFVVVSRSRVDTVPVSSVIDRNGKEQLTVETADVSGLPENWQWPKPVKLKGADNQTDIYGVVFRPPSFSPENHYPILEYSASMRSQSALPQGAFALGTLMGAFYYLPAALAALGFVVVMIEGRGTPLRNKAFQDHHYGELAYTSDLNDRIAGIRQLAKRYPYMDINRVGITAVENQTNAIYGLLHHADFYSVVVDHCLGDPRYNLASLGETDDGTADKAVINNNTYPENYLDHFDGNLFLIFSTLSGLVPGTFRFIEALQKANLTFDMLCLPNLGHRMTSYSTRREWDYLVTHLQGLEPPKDFKLTNGEDLFDLNKQ